MRRLTLRANAYDGDAVLAADLDPTLAQRWTMRNAPSEVRPELRKSRADERSWRDPQVGYGVILADAPQLVVGAKDTGLGAPEPIRLLIAERDAPVFRYRPDSEYPLSYLYDYANDCDNSIASAPVGTGKGRLPRYLLIYGEPADIPWSLQFALNAQRAVGRLHLRDDALARYVDALLGTWTQPLSDDADTLVWMTDHGPDDITALMSRIFAELAAEFGQDAKLSCMTIDGQIATHRALTDGLAEKRPRVIVTASHGMTGPVSDAAAMRAQLGMLVDRDFACLDPGELLRRWSPNGAIWYAHACCSAGSDDVTAFAELVGDDTALGRSLTAIAALGAQISPLPTALLGAEQPLRAFVGHVEPTFDWTLQDPNSGQEFGDDLRRALYDELFDGSPVGWALRRHWARMGSALASYDIKKSRFNRGENAAEGMLHDLLVARDVMTTVVLGDPTVAVAEMV